ncbi:MAG: MFS transporter [Methanomicrobiaceae archaeon]|nr:MFS transporter [Methanomicrobiaceae archaeon]
MNILPDTPSRRRTAYGIIILFGIVSMFGDVIYEGARSVTGPYLYFFGASALIVGIVAGLGEFLGYALRLVSGYVTDTTGRYWGVTFLGYGMLIAVPFLAFAGRWEVAAALFIVERMGKGIRAPAKDAILSNVTVTVGRGWGFGIHEAMDQIGAIIGPLIFTAAFLIRGEFQVAFILLFIPFFLMIAALVIARRTVPDPVTMESALTCQEQTTQPGVLLRFGIFTAFTMAGFAAFPLIAFHFTATGVVPDAEIPLYYAIAMGVDAVVALIIGRVYDRRGVSVLYILPLLGIAIPFAAFSTSALYALVAVVLWGAAMGVQETILRAAVADFTHISKRCTAYGVFNTVYGAAWFLGSVFIGWAYEIYLPLVIGFLTVMQFCAGVALFGAMQKLTSKTS